METLTPRQEAIKNGDMFYVTDKPCKRDHKSHRYTKTAACFECQKMHLKNWYDNIDEIKRSERRKYQRERYRNNPLKKMYLDAKTRSKQNGREFTIELEDIVIPEYCPILGTKLNLDKCSKRNMETIPSLDRIDNSKGYVKGNVRIISRKANTLKSDGSIENFKKIVDYMEGKI